MITIIIILLSIVAVCGLYVTYTIIKTVLEIRSFDFWDGNTYDLDEMDLESKKAMAREELKDNK